jgi:FtsP/CotA-like multicopper oxidase with cupredoxin domain
MKRSNLGPSIIIIVMLGLGLMGMGGPAYAQSPPMNKWVDPLPVPPVATKTVKPLISLWADYYEINMTASQHQFNSALGMATVWTYGQPGKTPVLLGPTIVATTGRPVVIKWINKLPTALGDFPLLDSIDPTIGGAPGFGPNEVPPGAAIPHLHGGHTAARFDGTPMQWWTANGIKGPDYVTDTFTYINDQPASLIWYHDHTLGATRFKPYLGLAAAYLVFDKVDNGNTILGQKVPAGYGKYHLPLVIQDKQFNSDGTLFYPTEGISTTHPVWVPEFFGDTPVINGKAYPYLDAQPRRYRLRLLNGSQARFYNLSFHQEGGTDLTFWVIGSEGGLLPKPAEVTSLLIAPGERYDVIVDFTSIPGSTVIMTNDAKAPYPDGEEPDAALIQLMKININIPVPANDPDNTVLPANLTLPAVPRLAESRRILPRDVVLKENTDDSDNPVEVLLNGYHFVDPTTDFIKVGTTETWQWINLTVDAHPMHPHLVTFQVVNRQQIDVDAYTQAWADYLGSGRTTTKPDVSSYLIGNPVGPAPEEMGFKDTVKTPPGYVTRTRAQFTLAATSLLDYDWRTKSFGKWVYHCHILEHEENDMMRPFVVVK